MGMSDDVAKLLQTIGLQAADQLLARQAAEIDRLRSFENDSERLKYCTSANKRLWTEYAPVSIDSGDIHIEDPVHQQVTIESEIAPIFRHPLLQRLGHIKQLSFSYLTYPTATHTRLSHSLGVCKNAETALSAILQRGVLYTRSEETLSIPLTAKEQRVLLRKAKVSALLHDIGHGPFGHGLDQLLVDSDEDDPVPDKIHGVRFIEDFLEDAIKRCPDLQKEDILRILQKNTLGLEDYDVLIKEIIDSPLDVDRMDYLVRDAHLTGLSLGTVNVQALISRMVPFLETSQSGQQSQIVLVFLPSAVPYITHLLYARDSMYLNCYEHPRKLVAEKMLMRAVQEFRSHHAISIHDLLLMTDEQLLRLLFENSNTNDLSYEYARALLQNDILFEQVFEFRPRERDIWEKRNNAGPDTPGGPPRPSEAVKEWGRKRLSYERKFRSRPKEFEEDIAKGAGLDDSDRWKVMITVPSEGLYQRKDEKIRILTTENGVYDYTTWDKCAGFWEDVLERLGVERYCFRVFIHRDLYKKREDIIRAAEDCLTDKDKAAA